ncbi:MAG: hypothetical protein AB7Q16_24790 [Vicinamibacterales bacterium]
MSLAPRCLKSARHVHPGVRTPAEYHARQAQAITEGRRLYPELPWRDPWHSLERPPVFVSGGKWLIECACGNCPAVAPEWEGLACCYECGAVYTGLVLPPEADEIERLLVARPRLGNRNWVPGEPLELLRLENRMHGVET